MRKLLLAVVAALVLVAAGATALVYWLVSGDGLRRAIEQQATSWLGQPVAIGRASAGIFPRAAILLGDVRVGEPARVTLAEVELSTDVFALLSRRIEDAAITIRNSRIEMPLPFAIPAGTGDAAPADGAAPPTGPVQTPAESSVEVVSVRTIGLEDVVVVSRGKEVRLSADSSLAGHQLTINRFAARAGGTTLDADGDVTLSPSVTARLRARADRLDLDELLALAEAFTPANTAARGTTRPSAPMTIAMQLTADSATAGGIEVRQFATDLQVEGERVVLSPLAFQLFGGRYAGAVEARLGDALALTIESRLQDLDVAQLAAFGGAPDSISGTLAASGTFRGSGADVNAVLASARGDGTATITNGAIRRLDLIRTIVLFFGRPAPDTADSTDRFERIDATASLANGIFRADTFSMRSRDVDVAGSGTLRLESQALDGALELMLSEELSKQAGTDLARFTREGNRVVLPARIGGTIAAPRVTIDAAAAARRGLRNEVQRRLKGVLDGFVR